MYDDEGTSLTGAQTLDVRRLAPARADDEALMLTLTKLINDVYQVAEKGLWRDDALRTTVEEVQTLTRSGEITVAGMGDEVVGCVRVHKLTESAAEFGMLVAAPGRRGLGVGRSLVRFAERHGRDTGRNVMQLELLVPREWSHPSKESLAAWYHRIGYRVVRTGVIEESYPHLAPLLATPCDFVIYQKDLRSVACEAFPSSCDAD
ncbi:GNAT family N-acetyltransferase [Streptomyces sp. NPDC001177]